MRLFLLLLLLLSPCSRHAATMLESCGRWLYCNKGSHLRTQRFLERMMGVVRAAPYFDKNLAIVVENAYLQTRPSSTRASALAPRKQRSLLHQYARKLLFVDLNRRNAELVRMRMRMRMHACMRQLFSVALAQRSKTIPSVCLFDRFSRSAWLNLARRPVPL
jgi:hypothetical protein